MSICVTIQASCLLSCSKMARYYRSHLEQLHLCPNVSINSLIWGTISILQIKRTEVEARSQRRGSS